MTRNVLKLAICFGLGFVSATGVGSEIADGNRLFVLERYEDAIALYGEVASSENQKEAAEALFGIAKAYQATDRWKLARDSFEKLLLEYPESELALRSRVQLGHCEVKLGYPRKAFVLFKEIQEKYAGREAAIEATYNIANLDAGFFGADVGHAREAIKGYLRVLSSDEGKRYAIPSHFGLGQCYMLLRDYRRAVQSFRAVIKEGPDTVWGNYARDLIGGTLATFDDPGLLKEPEEPTRLVADLPQGTWAHFQIRGSSAWDSATGRPALRINAVGFFTEQPKGGSGAEKVFYSMPTIHYKNYIFRSDRGTVDRVHRSVQCTGKVQCTDIVLPPTLTVTSGALVLNLSTDKAIFSRDVRFEKRSGSASPQQLFVQELHLLLDSGKIEVPPQKEE